jgi:glutathione S-transferase
MTYRLYDFAASPFCIKVRAILDYKGVEFERINTAGSGMLELRKRGKIGKVPALDIDGELICDSTDIAHELERRHPEPPILPEDPRNLALCHALEDWSDESLYWSGVYYRWVDPEGRAGASTIFPKGFFGQAVIPAVISRKARQQLEGQGTGRKSAEHIARDLQRQLGCLSQLLTNRDYLLEDTPMLCDFAVCGQLVYLRRTPHGARELEGHPDIVAFVERMRALRT